MKIRTGFVSNSSSTSFSITNFSGKELTLVDFIKENPNLVEDFNREYPMLPNRTQEQMIECAKLRNEKFSIGKNFKTYGDEDEDELGAVLDYMLRYKSKSKNFSWMFHEWRR